MHQSGASCHAAMLHCSIDRVASAPQVVSAPQLPEPAATFSRRGGKLFLVLARVNAPRYFFITLEYPLIYDTINPAIHKQASMGKHSPAIGELRRGAAV